MSNATPPLPIEISCSALKAKLDAGEEFLLLDCREPEEYEAASIRGAKLLPMAETPERIGELESHRGGSVVVHCHHGGRSLRVAAFLRQQGFEQAQSLAGGIDEWSQTIDPAVPRY
ncbi:MAG: rhodanese [Planctomycetota bacterium]|nr:MAG: rhodanese [Planctomycetota bacterium]REJ91939.1 MAG: rhodanese [Planctomycetota bacterium]REK20794.1 MAG: rhodanese [Planctomycetota bacterium]REK38100.1 MAG: rhodanese [Planctomycetota bacterium]